MRKNFLNFTVVLLLICINAYGQQDPQYTQYMYNMSVVNPAYAVEEGNKLSIGGLYRAQWVGSVGGPTTGTFFAHAPIGKRLEMGVSLVHDEIGDVLKETNFYVDVAYVVPLSDSQKLSFGLKAGVTNMNTDFNGFVFSDATPDPAFYNPMNRFSPNVGVGMYYFTDRYYIGLSAPNFLRTKHIERENGIVATGVEEVHGFFTGGYVFNLNSNLKFKPAFMAKAAPSSPISLDLTTNFLFHNKFEVGVGYRWDDAISGLVNFRVLPSLRIGYAYDYTLSNLSKFNTGSHEVIVLFDLFDNQKSNKGLKKGYDKSPRFF